VIAFCSALSHLLVRPSFLPCRLLIQIATRHTTHDTTHDIAVSENAKNGGSGGAGGGVPV
jgi:hypothetical protein